MAPIRVLFLASSPDGLARQRLDEEARAIEERIRRSEYRDIEVITKWAVRTGDLQEALLRHEPHIVHFSGHGKDEGIVLQGIGGEPRVVPGAALARMFATLHDNVRVVVFNACFSENQARAVTASIDVALGIREAMSEEAAIAFSSAFYMGLGYGRSVQLAFDIGVNELLVEGIPEHEQPVLLHRSGVDPGVIAVAGPGAHQDRTMAETRPGHQASSSRARPSGQTPGTPASTRARPEPRLAERGKPFVEPTTGIRFLWIPGGHFRMGLVEALPDWEKADEWAMPAHEVEVSPLWLGETAVSNAQYERFLKATGHAEPGKWSDSRFNSQRQPVVRVSWLDALAFCEWLSGESGLSIVLPTEAQWEFAARGPDGRLYPWGNEAPDPSRADFDQYVVDGQPRLIGSYPAGRGPFGTLDQAGNVWEWCRDAWDEKAYKKRGALTRHPYTDGPEGDAPSRTAERVVRGGSWVGPAPGLRAAYRGRGDAAGADDYLGFRVACLPSA